MERAGLGRPGLGGGGFEGSPFPHSSPGMILLAEEKTVWLDCAATFPALGVHSSLHDVIAYLRFCLEERRENREVYELAPEGKFVKAGFDGILREGKEDILQCKGHVSGFATGLWLANDVVGFAVFVNLDGVEGAQVRDEVGRVVLDLLV